LVDAAVLALAMATLGQVALCVAVLLMRGAGTQVYLPLAAFFVAAGVIVAGPAVVAFAPGFEAFFVALTLPAWLLLGPALWLYVEGLTSETPWRLQPRHSRHFILFGLGLIAVGLIAGLSDEARRTMLVEGEEYGTAYAAAVVLFVFALVLGWVVQSGWYVAAIFLRLARYRARLRNLFASNEGRELRWIAGLLMIVVGLWLLAAATVVVENFTGGVLVTRRGGAAMALLLVWSLAVWGLRQKPGFEGRYLEAAGDADPPSYGLAPPEQKYQRSALGDDQARRIAGKIEAAMAREQLYLDPALSLHKLARHLAVSPNHVSQTLNETIGASFFDYVNGWRVRAAEPQIIEGRETVLAIALGVGFNTRSSFYKTFRRVTGQTPGAFRAARLGDGV
jgi:AraC-like DNA-binding protein